MKKIILLFGVLSVLVVHSQNSKVTTCEILMENQELDKAMNTINLAVNHEKTKESARAWYNRGLVYQSIFESANEQYKSLSKEPLIEAYNSFEKAIQYDVKGKYTKEIVLFLTNTSIHFINNGARSFNEKNYSQALKNYEYSIKINNLDLINKIDTLGLFYAGYSSYLLEKYKLTIEYFNQLVAYEYENADIFIYLSESYGALNDSVNQEVILKKGIERYASNENLVINMFNYYIKHSNNTKALEYINICIENNPTKELFLFNKGNIFLDFEQRDSARIYYEKALEINPYYSDANNNLAVIYVDIANEYLQKEMDASMKDADKYKKLKILNYNLAIPYFNKVYEDNPDDVNIMKHLKELYYKTGNQVKYKEIEGLLKQM